MGKKLSSCFRDDCLRVHAVPRARRLRWWRSQGEFHRRLGAETIEDADLGTVDSGHSQADEHAPLAEGKLTAMMARRR